SDLHRMTSFARTIRREEMDRARARRLLGVLADPDELKQLEEVRRELQEAGSPRAFVPLAGSPDAYAATPLGLRAAMALTVRLERFGAVPVARFALRFRKVDDGIVELSRRVTTLRRSLPPVPKQRE